MATRDRLRLEARLTQEQQDVYDSFNLGLAAAEDDCDHQTLSELTYERDSWLEGLGPMFNQDQLLSL